MAKMIQFGGSTTTGNSLSLTPIEKMQLAAQIAAIVRASFKQLSDSDARDVMRLATSQLVPSPSALPE